VTDDKPSDEGAETVSEDESEAEAEERVDNWLMLEWLLRH
jgi:hypothetical protein